jgi:F-type H+-transporting ATPase subunit delta
LERLNVLYATALFSLALEGGAVDEFLGQASLLVDSLQDEDCQRMLVHPHISSTEKREFFRRTFSEYLHTDLLGFLFLVVDKNREAFLVSALMALIEKIKHHKNIVTARVLLASEYDEEQAAAMKDMLSKKLGKTVELTMKVDTSLIGGPYIYVDGYYLDWTVKKRLRDLTVHMKEGCSA